MLLQGLGDRPGQRRCGVAGCAEGRAHWRGTASMGGVGVVRGCGGGGGAALRPAWGPTSAGVPGVGAAASPPAPATPAKPHTGRGR